MHFLQPKIKAFGTVLWDSYYSFERHNALLTPDRNLRTFMVNKENRIVQYGNPIFHPEVITGYKNLLDNLNVQ